MKRSIFYIALFLIFLPSFGLAQESRYVEVTSTDTVVLKAKKIIYHLDFDNQTSFFGMPIPNDIDSTHINDSIPSITLEEVSQLLSKEKIPYSVKKSEDYSINGIKKKDYIELIFTDKAKLEKVYDLLSEKRGLNGSVEEVTYESISVYEEKINRNLYKKALQKATSLANISGNSIGKVISITDVSTSDSYLQMYEQMTKKKPFNMFFGVDTDIWEKEEIKNSVFKFELK